MTGIGHAASYPKRIPAAARFSSILLALTLIALIACTRKAPETKAEAGSTIQITYCQFWSPRHSNSFRRIPFLCQWISSSEPAPWEAQALGRPTQAAREVIPLTVGGKEISDFSFDLEHAKIGEASGRLGGVGKRIEIAGKSASLPEIQSTAFLEVYDDFPGLVFSSISFKNSGEKAASFDEISRSSISSTLLFRTQVPLLTPCGLSTVRARLGARMM